MRSHHRSKRQRVVLTIIIFGLLMACPPPPAPCPLVQAEEFKVGYVSIATLFDSYERTKTYDAQLQKQGQQKETELENRMNELKKLRQNLELLNDKARETAAREIEEKSDALKQFQSKTRRDLSRDRDQLAQDVLKDMKQAIEDYAKTNSFALILDERAILYGQSAHDVTAPVLQLLNSRYASKAKPQ